jgi:hypothetical protein
VKAWDCAIAQWGSPDFLARLEEGYEPIGTTTAPARQPDGSTIVVLLVVLKRRASPILAPVLDAPPPIRH